MADTKLSGRTALITGGSKGLGKAMALALGRAGARVAVVSRQLDSLKAAADEVRAMGGEAEPSVADVSDEAQVSRLAEEVTRRFGRVHILVNIAGMNLRKPVTEFSLAEWRQVMETNLTSAFLMCRALV